MLTSACSERSISSAAFLIRCSVDPVERTRRKGQKEDETRLDHACGTLELSIRLSANPIVTRMTPQVINASQPSNSKMVAAAADALAPHPNTQAINSPFSRLRFAD